MGLCESLQNGSSGLQTHRLLVVRNQADSLLLIILAPNWCSKQGNNTVSHSLLLSLSYGGIFQAYVLLCHPSCGWVWFNNDMSSLWIFPRVYLICNFCNMPLLYYVQTCNIITKRMTILFKNLNRNLESIHFCTIVIWYLCFI